MGFLAFLSETDACHLDLIALATHAHAYRSAFFPFFHTLNGFLVNTNDNHN